tara:strand:- start:4626 stop:4766 length:141 start_codon:yes stop_codon:yes gene_type:complete
MVWTIKVRATGNFHQRNFGMGKGLVQIPYYFCGKIEPVPVAQQKGP